MATPLKAFLTMIERIKAKSALHAVDLLLKHDPTASEERIADFVSEWGDLMEEPRLDDAIESVKPDPRSAAPD